MDLPESAPSDLAWTPGESCKIGVVGVEADCCGETAVSREFSGTAGCWVEGVSKVALALTLLLRRMGLLAAVFPVAFPGVPATTTTLPPGAGLLVFAAGEGEERLVEFTPEADGVGGRLGPCWSELWVERADPWLERLAFELDLTRNCSGLWPAWGSFSCASCSRVTVGDWLLDCAGADGAGAGAGGAGAGAVPVVVVLVLVLVFVPPPPPPPPPEPPLPVLLLLWA